MEPLIVKGQARDQEEAANIMSLVRRQAYTLQYGQRGNAAQSQSAYGGQLAGSNSRLGGSIVNLLKVPDE